MRGYAWQANAQGWKAWCKSTERPGNVPARPDKTYKDTGWQGWGHWLGTGNTRHTAAHFLPFDAARALVHTLGLVSEHSTMHVRGVL